LEDLQLAHKRILLPLKSYASLPMQASNSVFTVGVLTSVNYRTAYFRRAGARVAEPAAVAPPSPRRSSCSIDISRIAAGIFARPGYSLPPRETSRTASADTGSSKV